LPIGVPTTKSVPMASAYLAGAKAAAWLSAAAAEMLMTLL